MSNGSLVAFTQHCFIALETLLVDETQWPDARERESISSEFAKFGFPGWVGLIDGSLLPLSQ